MAGRRKLGKKREVPGQMKLPFGEAERKKRATEREKQAIERLGKRKAQILDRLGELESIIHEQTKRALDTGKSNVWEYVHRLTDEKTRLNSELAHIKKVLP